jgi:hypothetical protein
VKTSKTIIALALAGLTATLADCVTPVKLAADPHLLDFLQDGQSSKEAVLLKLGQPSAVLESGRVLTYRLGEEKGGSYFLREASATNWFGLKFSLVLVFDQAGVLQRHSLVPVR